MVGTLATYFELVVIGIDILLGILMLRILKGKETKARVFFIGTILFFFTHAACRTLYWMETVVVHDVTLNYIGTFLGLLCVEFIVIAIEMTVFTRSHHFFTIYGIAGLTVMAADIFIRAEVAGRNLNIWAQTVMLPVLAGIIILVFLNLAIKSVGRVRTAAAVMVIAIALFGLGEMANSTIAASLIPWAGDVGPIIVTAALVLLYYSVSAFFRE